MATAFDRLAWRVFDLYERGAYREALDLLDREGANFPGQTWHIGYWRVCLLARLGDVDGALSHFERLLARGLWIPVTMLRNDPDLVGLAGHPRFERAVAVCQQRQAEAQRTVRPQRVFLQPDGNVPPQGGGEVELGKDSVPLLVALHGNSENAARAADCWRFVTGMGWALLAPQSTQVMGPDAYHWDDLDRGTEDVLYHYRSLLDAAVAPGASLDPNRVLLDPNRVVVAGFSRGAALALHLVLSGALPARGVIALAPHLPSWSYLQEFLTPSPRSPNLRAYFLAGSRDEPAVRMSEDVARWMKAAGLPARVEVVGSMGHFYPPDLAARVAPLLAAWR